MKTKGWFGPYDAARLLLWPKSREGWITTAAFFCALIVAGRLGVLDGDYGSLIFFFILGVFGAVVYLTYDSRA